MSVSMVGVKIERARVQAYIYPDASCVSVSHVTLLGGFLFRLWQVIQFARHPQGDRIQPYSVKYEFHALGNRTRITLDV